MSDLPFREAASEVISLFGGSKALAALLSIPESTVRNWPAIGIPGKWHLRLLSEAETAGIRLSVDKLRAASNNTQAA